MEKKELHELFAKYLNNDFSAEELEIILRYFNSSAYGEELNRLILQELDKEGESDIDLVREIGDSVRAKIFAQTKPVRKQRIREKYSWLKYAAILIIVFLFKDTKHQESGKTAFHYIAPGEFKAKLITAEGNDLVLGNNYTSILFQENSVYANTENAELLYTYNDKDRVQMITPHGGQFHVILEDGSQVWLNAGSTLQFPVRFDNGMRVVTLVGEAYFDVAHDSERPFYVTTDRQQIKVIGTAFNVSAYLDDDFESTSLIEGKVKIKAIEHGEEFVLKPAQQLHVDEKDYLVRKIEPAEYGAWKDGTLLLNNYNLGQIVRQLERWYDVRFEKMPADVSNIRLFGVIDKTLPLNQVLKVIMEMHNDIEFEIQERRVMIKKK